jgi:hypothetical protein
MEHRLLKPRSLILGKEGIPLRLAEHLLHGSRSGNTVHHDANISPRYGIDDHLDEINRIEESLGELSEEQLNLRVAADLCCLWRYDYTQRVGEICEIIGGGPKTGLRLHYQISPDKRQEFIDYANALGGWLKDISPDDTSYFAPGSEGTTSKVYGFLGDKDPLKNLLVERTYIGLSARFLNCSFWGQSDKQPETLLMPHTANQLDVGSFKRMSEIERLVKKEMGRDAHDFLCDVGGSSEPACHFKFIRRVDILVSSIGSMVWRGNLPEKDGNIRGRRKKTALFLDVLENYWNGREIGLGDEEASREKDRLFGLLGEPTDFKRWLVASLWMNIKNQTSYQTFPMNSWVEFVQIGEHHMDTL